jgi:hypothetical protein
MSVLAHLNQPLGSCYSYQEEMTSIDDEYSDEDDDLDDSDDDQSEEFDLSQKGSDNELQVED